MNDSGTWRIEVATKTEMPDPIGEGTKADIVDLGVSDLAASPGEETGISSVRTSQVYLLTGGLSQQGAALMARELITEPTVQEFSVNAPLLAPAIGEGLQTEGKRAQGGGDVYIIDVFRKPGVMDPVEASTIKGAQDLGMEVRSAKIGRRYAIAGKLNDEQLQHIADQVLHNDCIEDVFIGGKDFPDFGRALDYAFKRTEVPILDANDEQLMQISREGQLSLTLEEMKATQNHFASIGRSPTDVELETLAQTWSEHCVHKTFGGIIEYEEFDDHSGALSAESKIRNNGFMGKEAQGILQTRSSASPVRNPKSEIRNLGSLFIDSLLRSTVMKATEELNKPWCVSVFKDNAGVIRFDDDYNVCFKVETHNHPSAIEPYGGAGTGAGGVIRDPLGTGLGAKPILNTDVFCFGPPDLAREKLPKGALHPKRIFKGVVAGVRDYGNRMGIPTANGAIFFDDRYIGNPLVYCGNAGIMPKDKCEKSLKPGYIIVLIGGRTGRDGIHGVTFSSVELTEESETISSGAVQIGNPITEKKVVDTLLQARDRSLYTCITDCGGGGLSSAVGEMGEDLGVVVDLEKVTLKYEGLSYTEIWISEAQERMIIAVPPENEKEILELFAAEDVEATVIGSFTGDKMLRLRYNGHQVADLDMEFLHNGYPKPKRKAEWRWPSFPEPQLPEGDEYGEDLKEILSSWNVCSKEWVIRQYDHEVQGGSVLKPLQGVENDGPGDACIVTPVLGSKRGIIISNGMNPKYGDIDPYWMAASAIDEALRQIIAVGGDLDEVALLDNFSWGNTDKPDRLGGIVRAARACYDIAVAYGAPFISGKDSLNNEFKVGDESIAIPPSLLISALAVMPDVTKAISMDAKESGNLIYIVGLTKNELGGSHYFHIHGFTGNDIPKVHTELGKKVMDSLATATARRLVRSCHDCSEGGLAVAAAEMAFAGGLGMELDVSAAPTSEDVNRDDTILFSESNSRFIVEVQPSCQEEFEKRLAAVPHSLIGKVVDNAQFVVQGKDGKTIINEPIWDLKEAWQAPLRW